MLSLQLWDYSFCPCIVSAPRIFPFDLDRGKLQNEIKCICSQSSFPVDRDCDCHSAEWLGILHADLLLIKPHLQHACLRKVSSCVANVTLGHIKIGVSQYELFQ